jgi:general L-amino acid transport system substrate-binding protein
VRNKEAKNPAEHVILPELISKEPLGPMVRRGDDEWFAIVKWVIYGLIEAEEYGITQANVDKMLAESTDPVVTRILGKSEDTGKLLGLDKDWMVCARSRPSATTVRSSSATSVPRRRSACRAASTTSGTRAA